MTKTRIHLTEAMFGETERVFLENDAFKVSLFRYPSGISAVRLENSLLNLIVLPFHGQQVWRFSYQNRNLTMKSIFDQPEDTDRFGLNYGAHLIHCGLTASGNPSPEDSHPLHGELPNCKYQHAWLSLDMDQELPSIALGGSFTFRNSLEYHYTFEPNLTLRKHSSIVDVEIKAANLRQKPMKYMYMAHINWLPVERSKLLSSTDAGSVEVFSDNFGLPNAEQQKFLDYVSQLQENPELADQIDSTTQIFDPELCLYMHLLPDDEGFAHALQVFPEADADYVAFRVNELPNAVRWYARTGDEDALAFAIPSTNNHLGFSRNLAKGMIREIPAKDSIAMHYRFGYLDKQTAEQFVEKVNRIKAARLS
jgi:hypothetical protein